MPVLVDEQSSIIAGHGRVLAARLLGLTEVPVMIAAGWTAAQKRAYIIADNQLTLNATWDLKLLSSELAGLKEWNFDLGLTGFSEEELAGLLEQNPGLTDPDAVPDVPKQPVSVVGDLWCLGRHRLVCGDATNRDSVELALGGVKPHLMVTDPPYGVNYDPAWRQRAGVGSGGAATGTVQNDDRADWQPAWRLFPGHVAYVWHGGLHCGVVADSLDAVGLKLKAQIVWVKTRPVLSRGHYHWQHEPAFYVVKDGQPDDWRFDQEHEVAAYASRGGEAAGWHGNRKQSTVWFIEHLKNTTGHGTQKPVECMKRPIENNSSPGQAVYDPFVGSGTTIIAAEMTARSCHAIEIDPAYVDVAVVRWQDFTGREATHADGRTFAAVGAERAAKAA